MNSHSMPAISGLRDAEHRSQTILYLVSQQMKLFLKEIPLWVGSKDGTVCISLAIVGDCMLFFLLHGMYAINILQTLGPRPFHAASNYEYGVYCYSSFFLKVIEWSTD